MIDPVPSPELSLSWSFWVGVGVGEELVFELGTVTTTIVGEPFGPILSLVVVTCPGGVVGELCGVVVTGGVSCPEVGDAGVVVVSLLGLGFCGVEGLVSGDVVVVVVVGEVVGEVVGDDGTTGEIGFWRGTNWTSWCARGSTSGFGEDADSTTMSERQMMKTMHRPGAIDLGYGNGIGISLELEPRPPEIPCVQVGVQRSTGQS